MTPKEYYRPLGIVELGHFTIYFFTIIYNFSDVTSCMCLIYATSIPVFPRDTIIGFAWGIFYRFRARLVEGL